jgi:hypothetical protein
MKNQILGIFLILLGISLGIYVGGYLMLFTGLVDVVKVVVKAIRDGGFETTKFAFGLVRMLFAGLVGWLAAFTLVIPGVCLFTKD